MTKAPSSIFSSGAEKAIFWTRQQLENPTGDDRENLARWDFLCDLPRTKMETPFLFVHGSPRNPLNEYVFPEDVFNSRKIEKLFSLVEHYCFQGHTHVPGVFTSNLKFHAPADLDHRFDLREEKVMVNVGSVGQPRDNDPRSCYVVLRDQNVEFRRVEYPLETTIEKIHAIPELDRFLGDRLRQGR
jgi:diadenosine tetraphosphatase ApaH/serine/threonine PP2A family protein phosphatase